MSIFDPGLQPERTELAWRRTALAIGVGSLVALRLLPAALNHGAWVFIGIGGLIIAASVWIAAHRRAAQTIAVLQRDGDRGRLPGAGLLAFVAAFALVSAAMAFVIGVTAPFG